MPRVLGIDPGTVSFDLVGLDDGALFLDRTVSTGELSSGANAIVEIVRSAGPLDLVVGPAGYGLPLVAGAEVGDKELALMSLSRPGEGGISGFGATVRALRDCGAPIVFPPGVVHLATVPIHRKANRIDMGTADKVCAAAFAIDAQSRRLGLEHGDTSLVLVEAGGAFTAVLSVDRGAIVDGQGGASGPVGYASAGAWDAEVACALCTITKDAVFSGGAAWIAGAPNEAPENVFSRSDAAGALALSVLVESTTKAVAAGLVAAPDAREIVLSGRLIRIPNVRRALEAALGGMRPVHVGAPPGRAKEAAHGAAMIADGLMGGAYKPLVETLGLREASGTALDHVWVKGFDEVREWFGIGRARRS